MTDTTQSTQQDERLPVYDADSEEFYQAGIDSVDDKFDLTVDQLQEWFSEAASKEDGDCLWYWVDAPYAFVTVTSSEYEDYEYGVNTPALSEAERDTVQEVIDSTVSISAEDPQRVIEFCEASDGTGDIDSQKVLFESVARGRELGLLQLVCSDPNITDVFIDPSGSVFVSVKYHSDSRMTTNLTLPEKVITNLKEQTIESPSDSIRQLTDYSDSVVQVSESIDGPAFKISFFTRQRLSVGDLLSTQMMDTDIAAYLWLAIESNRNILVIGDENSGKSSIVQAALQFTTTDDTVPVLGTSSELQVPNRNLRCYDYRDTEDLTQLVQSFAEFDDSYRVFDVPHSTEVLDAVFADMSRDTGVIMTMTATTVDEVVRYISESNSLSDSALTNFDAILNLSLLRAPVDAPAQAPKSFKSKPPRVEMLGEIQSMAEGFRISEISHRDATQDEFIPDLETSYLLESAKYESESHNILDPPKENEEKFEAPVEFTSRKKLLKAVLHAGTNLEEFLQITDAYPQYQSELINQAEEILTGEKDNFDLTEL